MHDSLGDGLAAHVSERAAQLKSTAGIPCLVLTHGRDKINHESLSSIIRCDPRLEIDVVHNPYALEDGSFIDFAIQSAREGKIRSFTVFDENISNNAFFLFLLDNLERYSSEYAVITDGDILVPASTVDEQISIFEARPDVMACGLRIDASRWDDSIGVKRDCMDRYNSTVLETEHCLECATGLWMTMFRGRELVSILETMRDNHLRLTDGKLRHLGGSLFQKSWVATKRSMGRELNRERPDYHQAKSISTGGFGDHSPEPAGSRYATWIHDLTANATIWSDGREQRVSYPALPPAVPRFRKGLESDPVVAELAAGTLRRDKGYVVKHLMFADRPGLAFVLRDARCLTGIPRLPGGRSLLFLNAEDEGGPEICRLEEIDVAAALLVREVDECRSVLETLLRFTGKGSLLHGLVFSAEAVRQHLAKGTALTPNHLPSTLRQLAADLVEAQSSNDTRADNIDQLIRKLWSDDAVTAWAKQLGHSCDLQPSNKTPYLARFCVNL